MPTLSAGWRQRRADRKTEMHWARLAAERLLSLYERFQQEWNFIEVQYAYQPSNNGLDYCNPAFAFDKKLARHVVQEAKGNLNHAA
jgi:hypothetical protein